MIITFFNDKSECGKSTLTILVAQSLLNYFDKVEANDRRVFIFDTATKIKNSLAYKNGQEESEINKHKDKFFIEHLSNYEEFEINKINFNIKETDVVFFDLQNFGEKQFDFLIKSNYVIVVSDSPNELERIDREVYNLIERLRNYSQKNISLLKKVFLTQNRVTSKERIWEDIEQVNYIEGLGELKDDWKIENISTTELLNPPIFIQKFALNVWKKINNYQEQIIV